MKIYEKIIDTIGETPLVELKKLEKSENLPEDTVKDNQDKIQKLTDKYIGISDSLSAEKEKEVMTV